MEAANYNEGPMTILRMTLAVLLLSLAACTSAHQKNMSDVDMIYEPEQPWRM